MDGMEASPFNGFPFFNLVVMPRGVRTFMHVANSAKGLPRIFKGISYETPVNTSRITRYLEDLCDIARESQESQNLSASILESVSESFFPVLFSFTIHSRNEEPIRYRFR